ncbi:hypothetical protein FQR65_LT20349 [Abscondita terminalis]|nr:hypothetical protein FQR65_LT20349 [Abscondita terminalis]
MVDKEIQPRFSAAEDEVLIELVAGLPILYDAKLKDYKNTVLRDAKWKKIGEQINKTANQCKTRWRSIRDHYKKLKKSNKLPTGTAVQKKNKKSYFERLRFLDMVETERESTTNVELIDMSDSDKHDSEEDNHSEVTSDVEEDISSQSVHSDQRNGCPSTSGNSTVGAIKKAQRNKLQMITHTTPAALSAKSSGPVTSKRKKYNKENEKMQEVVEDDIDLFFKTMAASVKKFPAHSKTSLKMKISQIVFEEEMRLSSLHASSMTTFNYSCPEYQITSPEATSSGPSSSIVSNLSYENSMSETIPVSTSSPSEPQLDQDLTLTPYWQSYDKYTD